MAITLEKVFANSTTYVPDHESNYTILEDNINNLLVILGGSSSSSVVPVGLQEIFDRPGVIGIGSFQLADQTVIGDALSIPPGAAWIALSFRTQAGSTVLTPSVLSTGTRYLDIDSAGLPNLSATSTADSIYSFSWDSGTAVISNATLLIDILFDGDDYNDSLTSSALAVDYTSMADRFEAIEASLGALSGYFAQDPGSTTALTFGYQAGITTNDNVSTDVAAGTVALTDNIDNYIEVDPSLGTVAAVPTAFTTLKIPLFIVTTSGGVQTVTDDRRTWASLGGGGGGGGHTQNTDTGTTSTSFTLNTSEAGTPSANAQLIVERGTSPNVDIRWNETLDCWESTKDGTNYKELGAPDLGVQELSKYVALEDPNTVVNLTGTSTDGAYVQVDLTAVSPFSSIPDGVAGIVLRIAYDDSAATAATKVIFSQIENASFFPAQANSVQARDSADVTAKQLSEVIMVGEGFTVGNVRKIGFEYLQVTSGAGTGNLKIFVMGYFEKVTGVGTQDTTIEKLGNVAPGSTTTQFNLTSFANRGLVHSIIINETTGTPTLGYNVKVYAKDTFVTADLLYQVDGILPGDGPPNWTDRLPWMVVDDDGTTELHMSIENLDAASATIDVTVRMEKFA